jgi:YaiO family outer membrane protein
MSGVGSFSWGGILPPLLACLLLASVPAAADSEDVIARARAASSEGRRAEGLALLETHLAHTPRDVDARLVYGLLLSWDARYDDARRELERVLEQAPGYVDARVALMNVEWWSGRSDAARTQAREILASHTGHPQASLVEQRLGSERPWTATAGYTWDWFDGERAPWHETAFAIARETSQGSVILRGSHAERFRLSDQLVEIEAYPRFRAGTYAYVGLGVATKADLYPDYRLGVDLYQSLAWGFEASAGYRRLAFSDPVDIYAGSLTKYWRNWMLTGRVYHVPSGGGEDSTSYYGSVRRYFGETGTSFVGLTYGHGLSREEARNASDLIQLDSDSLRAELDIELMSRLRLTLAASSSRQERAAQGALWQHTFGSSLGVSF